MTNNRLYTTKDVLSKVGVTRPTLYKWFKEGKILEVMRDRNNARLFTKKDIEKIFAYKNSTIKPASNGYKNNISSNRKGIYDVDKDKHAG